MNRRTRNFLLGLAALALLGLLLRLKLSFDLQHSPAVQQPSRGTDMATYFRLAQEILRGDWPEHFYFQPFYYAVFLPLLFLLAGLRAWSVMLAQALLGAACVWLTGLVGARLYGRRAGLAAAALLALARFHILYTPFMLFEVLQSFWLVLLLHLCLRAYDHNRGRDWALAAVVLSAAILTRGNALLLAPLLLALLGWRNRRRPARAAGLAATVLILVYLPQLPFALRNFHHYGRWTGPSSAQDAVLALGNSPEAPPGGLVYPPTYERWMAEANRPPAERTPVSRQILRWARREPLAFLELKLRTFVLFWDWQEIPNNINVLAFRQSSRLLRSSLLLDFALLGPLAIAGLALTIPRRSLRRWLATAFPLVHCLGTVIFYILARFRLPAVPLLCIFGGAAISLAIGRLLAYRRCPGSRPAAALLRVVLALAFGLALAWGAYPAYELYLGPRLLRLARPAGTIVEAGNQLLVFDHGSPAPFGWFTLVLDSQPVVVVKKLLVPADRHWAGQAGAGTVEFAFLGQPGSELELRFPTAAGPDQILRRQLPDRPPPHWLPMPWAFDDDGNVVASFTIRVLSGHLALAVDRTRNYRRTLVGPANQSLSPADFEAVARLVLTLSPPAPPDATP